jgi:hypothetical protein
MGSLFQAPGQHWYPAPREIDLDIKVQSARESMLSLGEGISKVNGPARWYPCSVDLYELDWSRWAPTQGT